jgi:hypothetical protein
MRLIFTSSIRWAALLGLMLLGGCHAVGPPTISRDRFDYTRAIADSWKQQTLLNIVKMRYLDEPLFLDVASVVSGYQWETSGSIGGTVSSDRAVQGNYLNVGATGRYIDRPTITYVPKTGDKFLESLLTPIAPARIFQLVQVGYAADFILEMGLESLNGRRNRPTTLGTKRKADPEFFEALNLIREIQDADGFGLRVEPVGKDKGLDTILFFRQQDVDPDALAKAMRVRELLGLPREASKFRLVFSPVRGQEGELAVGTRSMLQIMIALARGVDVPPVHQQRKLTPVLPAEESGASPILHVYSGPERPADCFAAVQYEKAWFWIADDDWRSKRTFTAIMFLFTQLGSGTAEQLPVLTIPTQ